ncbi:peptidoglycan bridge formation glycyltransferase FemA/FemB family protein [Candidatus Woesebacteria bacterium]|nr:peptidoglycan bridge formation glycyltransferase FemA/FemB family protein [Candidatus Woesebacteria bacterium]
MNLHTTSSVTKESWEEAITQFKEANFLQSWNWGIFHENLGKNVIRLLFLDEGVLNSGNQKIVGLALLVVEKAKRGNYITIAGGPIMDWQNQELFDYVFDQIKAVAREQKVDFIRFRPQERESAELQERVAKVGARPAQMHLTADLTLQLDVTQTEEELLSQMRKNHRYSIKKAKELGITVTQTNNHEEIKAFYDHQVALATRHGFVPFSYDFLHEQFKAFVQDNQVLLFHSYFEGKLLASAFIIFYNGEAVYHYGISTDENAKLPGSYLCQWAAIQEAKKRECTHYNFWGIAPEGAVNHRFAGVTMFKTGFGGTPVGYLHAQDIPLTAKYTVTAAFEFLRKKMRHL